MENAHGLKLLKNNKLCCLLEKQGWRSIESEGFRSATPVFLPPEKTLFPKWKSIRMERLEWKPAKVDVPSFPNIAIYDIFIYLFIYIYFIIHRITIKK